MGLPWVRLDTQFPSNPKILMLLDDENYSAALLYVFSLSYSGAHGTEGFIPRQALRILGGTIADAHELCDVRLWQPSEGGWDVVNWLEFQPSQDTNERRTANAKKGAQARWAKARAREEAERKAKGAEGAA